MLSLKGAVVSINAMGMQKAIVEKLHEKQADFVIGLKDNQPTQAADMRQLLGEGCRTSFLELTPDLHSTTENAHDGIEQREVRVIELPKDSTHRHTWPGLRTLAVVLKRIERENIETSETRFYLSSQPPQAELLARVIRSHWGIENSRHWTMDVTLHEVRHRLINRNGVSNLSAIRRRAVSILRQDTRTKLGAQNKRFKAVMDPDYILNVLANLKRIKITLFFNCLVNSRSSQHKDNGWRSMQSNHFQSKKTVFVDAFDLAAGAFGKERFLEDSSRSGQVRRGVVSFWTRDAPANY